MTHMQISATLLAITKTVQSIHFHAH